MAPPIQEALERRKDLSYFIELEKDSKNLEKLQQYTHAPGLSIFKNGIAVERVFEPVETLKSLDYLARIHETDPEKKVSLPEIDEALSLDMQASTAWRVYGVLKYLADNGRLQRDIDGKMDGPWKTVTYSTPDYAGLSLGFTPKPFI